MWNIHDEASEMETEVEIRTTDDPLEQGVNAPVLSEENCKYDYQNKCITNL